MEGKRMAICATSSKRKKIHHPLKSGLMIEGELVFQHDEDEAFCKGLTFDNNLIYMCGGRKTSRLFRKDSNGVIYILDKNTFELIEKFESKEIKAIKGVTILSN